MRKRTGAKKRPTPARRSPQAKALGLPLYRPRVVPGKRHNGLLQAQAAERFVYETDLLERCKRCT